MPVCRKIMSCFVIGDIQGHLDPLPKLLTAAGADPRTDTLWFAGDLVNRGRRNADTLRFIRNLGDRAVCVLGNHDFYLLAVASGAIARGRDDTLDDVLEASDRSLLIEWLRRRPLMHVESAYALVHAGLLAPWTVRQARELAHEVEGALQGPHWVEFLRNLWGAKPTRWSEDLHGYDRLRVIVNAMTRMRMCAPDGEMLLKHKGPIAGAPAGALPWFQVPNRQSATHTIVCGHWSALGFHDGDGVLALDTGCVWGGALTAVRLEDRKVFRYKCEQAAAPSGWE
jgi:bis(5'-nucleosyl)-tetraphosphatase (symmetrical)